MIDFTLNEIARIVHSPVGTVLTRNAICAQAMHRVEIDLIQCSTQFKNEA